MNQRRPYHILVAPNLLRQLGLEQDFFAIRHFATHQRTVEGFRPNPLARTESRGEGERSAVRAEERESVQQGERPSLQRAIRGRLYRLDLLVFLHPQLYMCA